MTKLSASNPPETIQSYSYDRNAVRTGIVHFGVGNFHRAHQAIYCENLLEKGESKWAITGVSLRSSSMRDDLQPQDYLYTLAVLGDTTSYRCIGALKNILVAPEEPSAIIDLIANPFTQIVSSTITEKGYYIGTDGLNYDSPVMAKEVLSLNSPKTIYGFIARGLIQRSQFHKNEKLTILCCDNISSGGKILKTGILNLLAKHAPKSHAWAKTHVSFISSMVDRVSPATTDALRAQVHKDTGRSDKRPVSAEPFSQWIIEDNFAGTRPNFDSVGAVFVKDVIPFEHMKLRYLNAAHTIVACLGYLSGKTYVHQALEDDDISTFLRCALTRNILPYANVPHGYSGSHYIESVISRFQNKALPYANLQVGTDSSQKIRQRWFPTIEAAVQDGGPYEYFQFALAAWGIFIKEALAKGELSDPKKPEFENVKAKTIEQELKSHLNIASADQFRFLRDSDFMSGVLDHAENIRSSGIRPALATFLSKHNRS